MALAGYGVLRGSAVDRRRGTSSNPHYQVHVVDDTTDYRVAVNVKSQEAPSEVLYLVVDQFVHPITSTLADLPTGFTPLASTPQSGALDFIRLNLFQPSQFVPLPPEAAGPANDLNDRIDGLIQPLLFSETADLYAFGQRWGPENEKDKIFGFAPGNGIHDIHMNQGNSGQFAQDNGVWQDGGLLVAHPDGHWSGVFLAFQSQSWHTDDQTGAPITGGSTDADVVIVAALVNPTGPAPERETVILLNTTPHAVDLTGWQLANANKEHGAISGVVPAGATVTVPAPVALSNKGGIITLLDPAALKVHGVSYTKAQASREGWTIAF